MMMNRLSLALVFSLFYSLLLGVTYSVADTGREKQESVRLWAAPWPRDARFIEVTVMVRDGFCVEPVLPFMVDYFDRSGNKLGTLRGQFFIREGRMCGGSYTRYYKVERPASSTGDVITQWTPTDGARRQSAASGS
jgi:hypothetical protein